LRITARLLTPLGGVLLAAARGRLHEAPMLRWSDEHAVTVVVALIVRMAIAVSAIMTVVVVAARAVDVGADLFAMTAACVRARMLESRGQGEAVDLADVFCCEARQRVQRNFKALFGKDDPALYRLAQDVLKGRHTWFETGIMDFKAGPHATAPAPETRGAETREPAGVR